MLFTSTQKRQSINLGYFVKNICNQDFSKIAKSGHTAGDVSTANETFIRLMQCSCNFINRRSAKVRRYRQPRLGRSPLWPSPSDRTLAFQQLTDGISTTRTFQVLDCTSLRVFHMLIRQPQKVTAFFKIKTNYIASSVA